jgi:hypothetical protein
MPGRYEISSYLWRQDVAMFAVWRPGQTDDWLLHLERTLKGAGWTGGLALEFGRYVAPMALPEQAVRSPAAARSAESARPRANAEGAGCAVVAASPSDPVARAMVSDSQALSTLTPPLLGAVTALLAGCCISPGQLGGGAQPAISAWTSRGGRPGLPRPAGGCPAGSIFGQHSLGSDNKDSRYQARLHMREDPPSAREGSFSSVAGRPLRPVYFFHSSVSG